MLKKPRNWIVTLCNKIIIRILLPTLKIKIDHISTSTRLMFTTLGRTTLSKVTYPAITWPHEVMWQTKNDISPLPRRLWLPNGKVELYNKGTQSIKYFDALSPWPSDHVTDEKGYISTTGRPMANKLDKVVGSVSGLSSNINEVIRSVLNFLFYFFHDRILHAQKALKALKAPKSTKKR